MNQSHLEDWESEGSPLSEAERAVWASVEREGLTPTEVAKSSGRDPSTVRTLLYRARKKKRGDR